MEQCLFGFFICGFFEVKREAAMLNNDKVDQ
jgi:hypothetical protein